MAKMDSDDFEEFSIIGEEHEDLYEAVVSRFQNSQAPQHKHLCAVVEGMAQVMKDQNLPPSSTAYFAATMASLDRQIKHGLLTSEDDGDPVITALCIFLAMVLPKVSSAVIKSKWRSSINTLVKLLKNSSCVSAGAARAGMKCIASLLSVADTSNWPVIAPAYGILLNYSTDRRPKVRGCAHLCLEDVLRSYQGLPVLGLASEGVGNLFEQFLLMAGGSNAGGTIGKIQADSNGANGAMEVLHILHALKIILPLMSGKVISKLLAHFKLLMQLRQQFLTRHVMNILYALCIHPSADVPTTELTDLLGWLASSFFSDEKSADEIMFAARLLDHGMKKIYDLDKNLCTVKLPYVFHSLAEVLAFQHEEAIYAASEALRSLTQNCIDDNMINQGVSEIQVQTAVRKSGPTPIERICTTAESLLGYQFSTSWDLALQVVSVLFDKLGESSYFLMRGVLRSLSDMQNLSDENLTCRKQLHKSVGSAVAAMGPEKLLHILPLNLDSEDLSESNIWLIPILKQHTIGASLKFFAEHILGLARKLHEKSMLLETEGRPVASRNRQACAHSLWALLPSFCNYPVDTAQNFQFLAKTLGDALVKEPELRGIICSSLQATIADIASVSDKSLIKDFFITAMQKLLKVTQEAARSVQARTSSSMLIDGSNGVANATSTRAQLLDLAASLLEGLDAECVSMLFIATKPALQDNEGMVQKKAYKVLANILREHKDFLTNNFVEIFDLLVTTMTSCHFSARRHRLDCLYYLIIHISMTTEEKKNEGVAHFLTEILLAVKESNKKTRTRAYELLVKIGHCLEDSESGGSKEKLCQFFNMVLGCLAGSTPHMMSAAVTGLARLIYEFSDLCLTVPNLLPSVYMLLQSNNKEVIKATLGLMKVVIARLSGEELQKHIRCIVEGLLLRSDDSKTPFKAKIRLLLEMLIRKCGLEAVKAVMPEQHMKLLTNIRKTKERKEKKKSSSSQHGEDETKSLHSRASTCRRSKWNHTDVFSEFGDEDNDDSCEDMDCRTTEFGVKSSIPKSKSSTLRSRNIRKSNKRLPEDCMDILENEPLDLLDKQKTRAMLKVGKRMDQRFDSDDEPVLAPDGRLVISEEELGHSRKRRAKDDELGEDTDGGSQFSRQSKSQTTSASMSKSREKRRKTSASGWAYTGNEYKSKKASGDIKKEGKLEPYAYWPLDRKMLNRREEKRAIAKKGLSSVVTLTKQLQGKSVKHALSTTRIRKQKSHKGKSYRKSK
ncbi:uncharacterized protein LOC131047356 isoform X2 [Cryptomeria japonica]|uniref:uncharacterized protein LOC131047356 isoform X2 n=1 Tax=Cryptomeria japonica TaxID=3369 RepID=UPI0027D9D592|nr:uncharacterized protein LOC131047356 isoform X2 [Cryptomeria japonica]